jgi:hypothetical protein
MTLNVSTSADPASAGELRTAFLKRVASAGLRVTDGAVGGLTLRCGQVKSSDGVHTFLVCSAGFSDILRKGDPARFVGYALTWSSGDELIESRLIRADLEERDALSALLDEFLAEWRKQQSGGS